MNKKVPTKERQRRISEGLRLSWAYRKAEKERRHNSCGNATNDAATDQSKMKEK